MPPKPLEAYAFGSRLGKRLVFILDPHLLSKRLILRKTDYFARYAILCNP